MKLRCDDCILDTGAYEKLITSDSIVFGTRIYARMLYTSSEIPTYCHTHPNDEHTKMMATKIFFECRIRQMRFHVLNRFNRFSRFVLILAYFHCFRVARIFCTTVTAILIFFLLIVNEKNY